MDRRNRKTKDSIKRAMKSLIANKAVSDISMVELANAADINRSTLYTYYNSPNEIFDELSETCFSELESILGDEKYSMASFIEIYLDYMLKNKAIFVEIHRCKVDSKYLKSIEKIMNDHMKDRKLPQDEIIQKYCNYGFFGIAYEWLKDDCKVPKAEILKSLKPVMEIFD